MQDYSILPSDLETNPAILVILQPSQKKMNHWPTCHVPRDIAVFYPRHVTKLQSLCIRKKRIS